MRISRYECLGLYVLPDGDVCRVPEEVAMGAIAGEKSHLDDGGRRSTRWRESATLPLMGTSGVDWKIASYKIPRERIPATAILTLQLS